MKKFPFKWLTTTFLTLIISHSSWVYATNFATVTLQAGMHLIAAEVADDSAKRMQGLMYRRDLPGNQGMVFVFPQASAQCMWMKNTYVPLSVAFIDDQGKILNIAHMEPLNETSHCSKGKARYALEMRQGWFEQKGVVDGQTINGLTALRGQ
jgi:uncharacterized membrane protein (UPF0127 family)